jgi:hypothetical protein
MRPADPAAHVSELLGGFWPIHVLNAMAELELPEALADGPASAGALAQRLGLRENGVFRILRAGTALGLCEDLGARRFALTDAGQLLRGDVDGSLRGQVLFYHSMSRNYGYLSEIVRTGDASRSRPAGPEAFEQLGENPEALDHHHQSMVASSRNVADDLCRVYDFNAHKTVVDVGGGYGGLLCEVLKAYPHLTGKVFDLPSVERGALAYQEGQGLADRAGYVPGSFFDGPPPPADCYLLKFIIHDWDDDYSRQILASCRDAMSEDSVLLLIDRLLPDHFADTPEHRRDASADIMMMVHWGQERSQQEMFTLLDSTGLRPVRIVGQARSLSVVEVRAK